MKLHSERFPTSDPPSPSGRGQGEGVRNNQRLCIPAILLAAGKSTRMGRQKLLLPYAGATVIAHVARQILASAVSHLIVVTSTAEHDAIADALRETVGDEGRASLRASLPASRAQPVGAGAAGASPFPARVQLLANPDPAGDMLSSVRCGLRATPPHCSAVLVATGDHPSITPHLIDRMIDAFRATPRIIVPTHAGRRGHPLLFPARYRDEVLTHFDTLGLRALLSTHPHDLLELPADESILHDLDTPADYQRALDRL